MSERVLVDIDNHVATVILNRAEKRNAVDFAMFDGIAAAAEQLANNATVRAVVLAGDGTDFCAGIDIGVCGGEGSGAVIGDLL